MALSPDPMTCQSVCQRRFVALQRKVVSAITITVLPVILNSQPRIMLLLVELNSWRGGL